MCGIAGLFRFENKQVDKDFLHFAVEAQNHRGPDYANIIIKNNVGLAHNRLSILDTSSAGNQPFNIIADFILVYNGEIYNFKSLKTDLIKNYNVEFQSTSDTEVLYYSLIYEGVETTLRKVKGMFAFAFYNNKNKQLFIARDRLGIKPLFYTFQNNAIYFSSEIKALVLAPSLNSETDVIRTFFSVTGWQEYSRNKTMFKNIFHVEPGTYLSVDMSGYKKNTYFKLTDFIDEKEYHRREKIGFKKNLEELDELMIEVTRDLLQSDAPIGAYVSGGIDSSIIAYYASKIKNDFFPLFTANVIGKHSEFEDAKLLSNTVGTPLYAYDFQPEYFLRDWAKATYHYEVPIIVHANSVPFSNVSYLAHQHEVKAVLTGEGSDELFLGYPHLLTRKYTKLIKLPYNIVDALYKKVPSLYRYLHGGRGGGLSKLFNPMVSDFESSKWEKYVLNRLSFIKDPKRRHEQKLTLMMLYKSLVSLLWRNDRMGMIYSIESRFPFLDERVLKFGINLPSKYKIGYISKFYNYKHPFLIDKKIVRKLGEQKLPAKLVYKKKKGFPLYGLTNTYIEKDFFKDGFVQNLLSWNNEQLEILTSKQMDNYLVSKFASLEIWGRIFIMKESLNNVRNHIEKYITLKH